MTQAPRNPADASVDRADWPQLLRLLDRVLEMPEPDRALALESLSGDEARLRDALQRLLDLQGDIEADRFLEAPPRLQAPLTNEATPMQLGPWKLLRELGRGGMSVVFLAERVDAPGTPAVALKLPLLDAAGASVLVTRFERERDILALLDEPGIVRVRDAGVSEGRPWLALDFVDGTPIVEHATRGMLSVRERIALMLQVIDAVAHAHAQLVIHRDIKPANVLVDRSGRAKLLDFGVAKLLDAPGGDASATALTLFGGRAMTPRYASPEQIGGGALGTATDIYSLGVLLFELLTGAMPYTPEHDTAHAWERAIVDGATRPPSRAAATPALARALRDDLDAIVVKAMALQPGGRYASAAAFADDLRRHLGSQPVLARRAGAAYRMGRHLKRHALAWGAGSALALTLGAGVVGTLWQARAARDEAQRANAEAQRANAVQRFVLDIFKHNSLSQSDPRRARETTARALLDIGSANVERALGANPAAKKPVVEVLAQMYSDLGLTERALPLRREAVALAGQLHGPDSLDVVEALADLSAELHHEGGLEERRRALEQGLARVQALPDRPSAARVKLYVAWSELEQSKDHARARAWADRAVDDAERLNDDPSRLRAYEAAADARYVAGDAAGGVPWFERALATAERCACRFPSELLRTRTLLAEGQALLMQPVAAVRTLQRARDDAERYSGPRHIDTLQVTIRLALTLQLHGRFAESLALLEPLRAVVDAPEGADEFNAPQVYNGLAGSLSGLGRTDEALAAVDRGITLRDRARAGTPYAATLRETRLRTLIDARRFADAAAALADADRVHRAYGAQPGDRRRERLQALTARLQLAQGDVATALQTAAGLSGDTDLATQPSLRGLDTALLRAEIELAAGQAAAAQPRLLAVRRILARDGLAEAMPRLQRELARVCALPGAPC